MDKLSKLEKSHIENLINTIPAEVKLIHLVSTIKQMQNVIKYLYEQQQPTKQG